MSIGELRIGSRAATSYYDAKGVLLIAEGVEITSTLVEKLRRHGIETLHVRDGSSTGQPSSRSVALPSGQGSAVGTGVGRSAAQKPRRAVAARPPSIAPPEGRGRSPGASSTQQGLDSLPRSAGSTAESADTFAGRGSSVSANPPALQPALRSYSAQKVERISRLHARSLEAVERITASLGEGRSIHLQETDPVVDGYIKELAEDADPVVANALLYDANLDLAKRCVQFSTLTLAVGLRMDLSSAALKELGRAALIHDWGLFEMPPDRRFPHQKMTDAMRQEYQQHPVMAEAMMQSIRGSTFTLAVLVTQVHELMNGTGFPRRLQGSAIHPLARVLCVIDTYLTLTSPPPGHPRIVPCDAVAFLLHGVKLGHYAPTAVSSLLETVTLYPIGSLVDLSDATQARVVRSNGRDYGYPIVERLDDPGEWINLKEHSLFVTRPVLLPEYNEVRLPDTYTALSSPASEA